MLSKRPRSTRTTHKLINNRLYFAYCTRTTRDSVEAALADMHACGDVQPGTIIARNGNHYSVFEPIE